MKHTNTKPTLFIATIIFAINFSVWLLYAALALPLVGKLGLSSIEFAWLLSSPMFTAIFFSLLAGFFSQWYNPKKAWALQMLAVLPALIFLPFASSFIDYLLLGAWLGVSGMSFTFAIAYITPWLAERQQGTMMGLLGIGNSGAAITLVLVPYILARTASFDMAIKVICGIYVFALLLSVFVLLFLAPKMPLHWKNRERGITQTQWNLLKDIRIWRFGLYYFFVFGSFVALLLWLPQYYLKVYKLSMEQAMAFTLFFIGTSSIVRVLGGWFTDRYGARIVYINVFWICLVCLFFLSYPPTTMIIHGLNADVNLEIEVSLWLFTCLLFVIGIAQGIGRASIYKLIHDYYPENIEVISGFVTSLGVLGGFILPILFAVMADVIGIHTACFMLLYGVLALCMIINHYAMKAERYQRRLSDAMNYNFLEDDRL